MNTLPNDILKYIFGLLSGKDRANICTVCLAWNTLACITSLGLLPNLKRGASQLDTYKDYHLFVLFKPTRNIAYACITGNLEIFKHLYDPLIDKDELLYYVGISGCVEIFDLIDERKVYCENRILLMNTAIAAGCYNNPAILYRCWGYITKHDFNTSVAISNIYSSICQKCSADTLRDIETNIEFDYETLKNRALRIACKYNNFDVIDYFASTIDDLSATCTASCQWDNDVPLYLMKKYSEKISVKAIYEYMYNIADHIIVLKKLPQLFTEEQVNELSERAKIECYYMWESSSMVSRTYEKEFNEAYAIWLAANELLTNI